MKNSIETKMSLILNKLKKERLKTGLSQWDFGEKIGLSQNAYYKLGTGKTKLDLYRFLNICKVLDIEPSSFF
ncbi:helix-turn-helix transcriptional regulator [Tenacibaculum finnmarkense]|uniref:helix-turn-helix transcriptional regulator n=1 Tax=Tenacibaculum finnmarkense TaxID=2781243 RepID=UPI00187B8589|nr:helix-turn-helix transcriptional regulator [Tenacibaculum finnmarkense]MBE7660540.1 helix-turn-helix domain-containing protein [Tenacibaculum finnmarkense genomovar finnmarkense]MCG8252229.1 helix-turn-helix transcriptional regulator [Tenacibaculum finnmarkense genomovar finnmarkense]MCG8815708.1 helix-turn-helix transcriptional regulator [Tenacibaculum finnmarkense]MCG8821027.1 helix-turn-helix transcriptional regulator [Tenacibaculum finnmarkense]WCC44087.1 helix-turn-helix transcriptiona